jgi:hypothetical protein
MLGFCFEKMENFEKAEEIYISAHNLKPEDI